MEIKLAATAPRSFEDLVAMFPALGAEGARAEAHAQMNAATSHYEYLDDVFGTDSMIAVLRCWSANNTAMMEMAEGRLTKTDEAVRQDAIEKRLALARGFGQLGTGVAANVERSVDAQLSALEEMARSGQRFSQISMIHRGAAVRTDLFDGRFKDGATVRWEHMTACTLNPDSVPIHFAWKQRKDLLATAVAGNVTSFLLNLRLDEPVPLVWASAVPGKDDNSTFRWQAEVITPPGFEFEVTSVKLLKSGPPDRLVVVEARYPVSGSRTSSP